MAEILAIRNACHLAISQGWHNATIESDSKLAISFVSSESDPPWTVAAIIDDIKVKIPVDEEGEPLYEDLICHKCSSICSFLHLYPPTIWASEKEQAVTPSKEKDVVSAPSASGSSSKLEDGTSEIRDADPVVVPDVNSKSPHDDKDVVIREKSVTCLLGVDLSATELAAEKSQPVFLAKNWREALCGCDKCSDFYAKKGIIYLLDKEDSIAEYEKMAKQKRDEKMQQQEGAELNFHSNLGHAEKIEILSGIADMKDEIRSFLSSPLDQISHTQRTNLICNGMFPTTVTRYFLN